MILKSSLGYQHKAAFCKWADPARLGVRPSILSDTVILEKERRSSAIIWALNATIISNDADRILVVNILTPSSFLDLCLATVSERPSDLIWRIPFAPNTLYNAAKIYYALLISVAAWRYHDLVMLATWLAADTHVGWRIVVHYRNLPRRKTWGCHG